MSKARVTEAREPAWPWTGTFWMAVVVCGVYLLAARLSLALLTPDGVAVFWPAAGVAAGALIALGPRARLAVVIGTMVATLVANLLGDRTVWGSIVFAFCNAGEALLTAALIERYFGPVFNLDRLRHVLGFLAAAVVGTAVSGIGGTLGFVWFHDAKAPLLATWQNWLASDALGIITVAPLLIGLASVVREPPPPNEAAEGFVALATLVIVSTVVILLPAEPWKTVVPIVLLFPLILWIAARCRPVFAAAAAFIVTLSIVWTTTVGIGHFGDLGLPMADRVLGARAGIMITALCAYVLAALFAERREHAAALMESEARVQQALTAGAVSTFIWDLRKGSSQRSANAPQLLGLDPRQDFSAQDFLARVHRDDRERYQALVRGVRPESPTYSATFRFTRPDGTDIWLDEIATAEFDAVGRRLRFNGLTLDVTARKQADRQQGLLAAEHQSRIKALLGRIAAMVDDMRRHPGSLDRYAVALQGRIRSMADTYALLSNQRWHGADLATLVRQELRPYAADANTIINGPDVVLPPEASQALGLALHELATNASAYGALSTPHGRVEISWGRVPNADASRLLIEWREVGGPAIGALPKHGYGIELIRGLVEHELRGAVTLDFAAAGTLCKIEIPIPATAATLAP